MTFYSKAIAHLIKLVLVLPLFCEAQDFTHLPEPVTNNAVTQVTIANEQYIISFSGLGSDKSDASVHNKTFVYQLSKNQWQQKTPVPIATPIVDTHTADNQKHLLKGRLASVATSIGELAYVFGGYTVASNHSEVSVPDVYSYQVLNDRFNRLTPMPVPVDDSVALTYQDRYIYLVSGWHNDGNVNLVQVYDTKTDSWSQASPFPGKPVFGHAGAIVNNKMMICDGVKTQFYQNKRRTYAPEPACYMGVIAKNSVNVIDWRIIPHPTGIARYRMAAVGDIKLNEFVFIGGSNNPYNYSGIGYNGLPSEPDNNIWRYDINANIWKVSLTSQATMDHRGLLKLNNNWLTIGGMGPNQKVLDRVTVYQMPK